MKNARKLTAVALAIMLCLSMLSIGMLSASAFSQDNFKAQIKEISVGAPVTSVQGGKYLPVDIHFTAAEDISNEEMAHFIEGYLRVKLKDGTLAEGINGLGMTLIGPVKPDVDLDNNMWSWNWKGATQGGGEGVIKFNLPLLDEGDTQAVEKSGATGQEEVNGLKVGDEVTVQVSTVVNTDQLPGEVVQEVFPDGPEVLSDKASFTIENLLNYPRKYNITAYDTTEPESEETTTATEETTEATETSDATEGTTESAETTAPDSTTEPVETTTAQDSTTEPVETTTVPVTTTEAAETTEPSESTSPEATTEPAETGEPVSSEAADTTSPEATSGPEATTSPTETASGEVVVVDPTQATTGAEYETVNPTTPDYKPTQPGTEPATGEVVIVEPTTGPASDAPTETIAPTQPATESRTLSLKDAKVTSAKAGTYDGKEKKPEITVTLDGKKLTKGVDFIVAYKNNINAGKGTAVITGKGAYKDSTEVKFEIAKANNSVKVKTSIAKVKAKKLKTKKHTLKSLKISKANGKVKVKIVKSKTSKKIRNKVKVNKKGVITLKKGVYSKGKYTVTVKITVKGDDNHNPTSFTKKLRIKIK